MEEQVTGVMEPAHANGQTHHIAVHSTPETKMAASHGGASSYSRMMTGLPVDDKPVPVVKVLSVRGVEYAMMSILLWFGAGSLITVLVTLVMGGTDFDNLAFPVSMLLVCLPAFAWLFLRLRKAELDDPALRLEPSKRRFSQITQILSFLTCFFTIVTVIYTLVSKVGGNDVGNIGKVLGVSAVILAIAGGILTYYWFDEHKLVNGR